MNFAARVIACMSKDDTSGGVRDCHGYTPGIAIRHLQQESMYCARRHRKLAIRLLNDPTQVYRSNKNDAIVELGALANLLDEVFDRHRQRSAMKSLIIKSTR